jgi:tRNA A-37 threonylcarbamoyl transferase component Bud32
MRLLLIDDDPRYRALVRHHVTCTWPEADIIPYNPTVRGPLAPDFLAQGFDLVLLKHNWNGGNGWSWLSDLAARSGFAPVVFLAPDDQAETAESARNRGAFAAVAAARLDHEKLTSVVRAAALQQQNALAAWHDAPNAREAQTFGAAFVRGYRRVRRLASGSVSDLYLAESIQAGALVVLKVTRDARRDDGVDQGFARFLQEYEIVRSVRHPHVVHIHDLGVADEYAYLVMEYFARGDLRGQMRGPLPPATALEYALEIAEALDAIHRGGVLHRDVKPGNVMIRDDGSLALIDFGLAKHRALELEITDKGLIFGTPHYMSPEQGHGQPVDGRSDLYALGIVLYEMLTGIKPFDGDNPMTIIYRHAKSPLPQLPEPLQALQPMLDRLLAKRPDDRYADAALAAVELRAQLAAASAVSAA